jgi:colanic acid biosynthesis glycosyl transferase WcaI
MNFLILGLNYAPEPVGIGPYTAGTAEFLAAAGHDVTVVGGKPYYPNWEVQAPYRKPGVLESVENGVRIRRVPIYVPSKPNGARRLLHHASFALRAFPELLRAARAKKPDVLICIAPSLISMAIVRVVARIFKAKTWLHIQDFEVEAAFVTGLLPDGGLLAKAARAYEKWCFKKTMISTISPQMCEKLRVLDVPEDFIYEFRNWANIDDIKPLPGLSKFRDKWGIKTPHVALYSGNIGNKQGIEIILDVARLLVDRDDLTFVICGNGASREKLMAAAKGLPNVLFHDLQPVEMMSELLGLATVHLLPQIAGAADLVLPSKLANMLASGRSVLATAHAETGLAHEVEGCGRAVPPEDATAMAHMLGVLLDDAELRCKLGNAGRERAEKYWGRKQILASFSDALRTYGEADRIQSSAECIPDCKMSDVPIRSSPIDKSSNS